MVAPGLCGGPPVARLRTGSGQLDAPAPFVEGPVRATAERQLLPGPAPGGWPNAAAVHEPRRSAPWPSRQARGRCLAGGRPGTARRRPDNPLSRERRIRLTSLSPAHSPGLSRLKPVQPDRQRLQPAIFPFGLRPNSSRDKIAVFRRPPLRSGPRWRCAPVEGAGPVQGRAFFSRTEGNALARGQRPPAL